MAKKHFMMYYKQGTGTYIITEPMPWSRENRGLFLNYDFTPNNRPTTNYIEDFLINNYGFTRVFENDEITLIQNLNFDNDL
jgi:hypothetical protein